ncbi:MAG: glycosyltransferase [Ignavibacteriales bacterium]|nr:glycosyltransferase [Ignavibacteriales bacterium]
MLLSDQLKYSIIIPTLNEEALLPKLLNQLNDKILKSNYDYEIIISDGGSKDKTLEISRKLADKIIPNQEQGSQNIATGRNIGAKSASGEILIFLNGDVVLNDAFYFFDYLEKRFINSKYHGFHLRCLDLS